MNNIITNLGWKNREDVSNFMGLKLSDLKQNVAGEITIGMQLCKVGDLIARGQFGEYIVVRDNPAQKKKRKTKEV